MVHQLVKKSQSGSSRYNTNIYFEIDNPKTLASLLMLNKFYHDQDESDPNSIASRMRKIGFSRNYLTEIQRRDGSLTCTYCNKPNLKIELEGMRVRNYIKATIDHIVPLSKGGLFFDYNNINVCCGQCNSKKDSMDLEDFLKIVKPYNTIQSKKDNGINELQLLTGAPNDLPLEFLNEMTNWEKIHKSPYSFSYYSEKVDWNYKPDGSYRIADHWNFTSQNKKHCETTTDCPNNTHWTLAKFDGESKKYVVVKSIEKSKINIKKSFDFQMLFLEFKKIKAIDTINQKEITDRVLKNTMKCLELKYLNKYFKLKENHLVG